jgi:hypothetical protein
MPQVLVAATIAGVASGAGAVIAGTALTFGAAFAIGFIGTAITAGLQNVLAKKPGTSGVNLRQSRTISVRNPAAVANAIYGEVRTGGTVVYIGTTDDDRYLHMVVVLAGHECESIEEIYFNGRPESEFDQFNVGSSFRLRWNSFDRSNFKAFEVDIDRAGTLDLFTGNNAEALASSINASQYYIASATGPAVVEVKAQNSTVLFSIARAECDFRRELFDEDEFYVEEQDQAAIVDVIKIGEDVFRINKHLGASDQAADADLVEEVAEWGSNHRLRGLCYIYCRLKWSIDAWQGEVPAITARMRGKNDIYDPRSATNVYTANSALVAADYIVDDDFGMGADYAEEIDEAALIAAANVCDEDVTLDAGGSENRYESHTVFATDTDAVQMLGEFQQAMAGRINWSGGVAIINAGAWRAPTLSFDESDLVAGIEVSTGLARDQVVNGVRGTFFAEINNDQLDDFPPMLSTTFQTQDNGEALWRDIELNMTKSASMAQRIAKILLLQARQDISVTAKFNLTAMQFKVGDVIQLNNARYGWIDKTFECERWALASMGSADDPNLAIDVTLRETAANLYDWQTSEESSYDPSPDTTLQDPFVVLQVRGLIIDSTETQLFTGQDGSVFTRVRMQWTNPDAYVVRFRIEARNRAVGVWESFGETSQNEFTFGPFKDGDRYDFSITSINYLGRESPPLIISNRLIVGKTSPPPNVPTFQVLRMADGTREYSWTYPDPPLDLAGFEIRSAKGLNKTWDELEVLEKAPKDARRLESNQLAAGAYTVGIKAFDTSGNTSVGALLVDSTLGNPRLMGALLYIDFAGLGWPDSKFNCWVDPFDGVLYPDSKNTWATYDASRTWDDWTAWLENPVPDFEYVHNAIDLGAKIVFTPLLTVIADADVTVFERHSDDNAVWSEYAEAKGQLNTRWIQLKIKFSTL